MFTFVQTKQNAHIQKKWERFLIKCTKRYNAAGIEIDSCLLQSILIQSIYSTYLIQTNKLYYGFDYASRPIQLSDISFWKVCKMEWNNQSYLFHKTTQTVFQSHRELMWKGVFDFTTNTLLSPEECPIFVRKWFTESKIAY